MIKLGFHIILNRLTAAAYEPIDYQGNVRAVISQNGALEEVKGYYPHGGLLGAPATGVQARKYGGKELDRENALDWLDSQARMYDPLTGRTPTQDPLAEKYYNLSPYLWCAGNPLRFIDLTGKEYGDHLSQNRCN